LEWAEGTYPTSHGIIKVSARKVNGETVVDIDAPDEIVVLTE